PRARRRMRFRGGARTRSFPGSRCCHGPLAAPRRARAAAHGGGLQARSGKADRAGLVGAAFPGSPQPAAAVVDFAASRAALMHRPVIHVIGAGLAGLAAALRIGEAGIQTVVHEAAGQAGGRCRSYYDGVLAMNIDNGNHLVLSGNYATADYLRRIGAADRLTGPAEPEFPFNDLATKQRWRLRPNAGRLPWWIFAADRRVPETGAIDYLAIARLLTASAQASVADVIDCHSILFQRLWRPLLLAALNTDPSEASARLAAAIVREALLAGAAACRPLIASAGLFGAVV